MGFERLSLRVVDGVGVEEGEWEWDWDWEWRRK